MQQHIYSRYHSPRLWKWLLALVCMLGMASAQAGVQELRIVGVGVDQSSGEAEAQALDYAKKRAVYLAARKLGAKDVERTILRFSADQWGQVVRGVTVSRTRREGYTTYIEANVSIVTESLERALKLQASGNPSATGEYDTRGVLVLPVYAGKDRAYLWEKENALRGPLNDEVLRQSRGVVLLAGGDLEDMRLIDYQNALTVTPEEMKPMFERYGAEEIILAVLTVAEPGTTDASSVLLRRLRLGAVRHEAMEFPAAGPDETKSDRIRKAAVAIAAAATDIATSTAERDARARAQAKQIAVTFIYRTPKDLARMQQIVRAAPAVMHLEVPSITLARVTGTIYLKGEEAALREQLAKGGVMVTPISTGWRLSMQ